MEVPDKTNGDEERKGPPQAAQQHPHSTRRPEGTLGITERMGQRSVVSQRSHGVAHGNEAALINES